VRWVLAHIFVTIQRIWFWPTCFRILQHNIACCTELLLLQQSVAVVAEAFCCCCYCCFVAAALVVLLLLLSVKQTKAFSFRRQQQQQQKQTATKTQTSSTNSQIACYFYGRCHCRCLLCQGLAQLLDKKCHDPKTSENINFNHGATETAPWMASIYKNNQFICDGTLVHKC